MGLVLSLLQVFVSIKGIYYQADVLGQTVTWIVPHARGFQVNSLTISSWQLSVIVTTTPWSKRTIQTWIARSEYKAKIQSLCVKLRVPFCCIVFGLMTDVNGCPRNHNFYGDTVLRTGNAVELVTLFTS